LGNYSIVSGSPTFQEFSVFQNPVFLLSIQPQKLFVELNSGLKEPVRSVEQIGGSNISTAARAIENSTVPMEAIGPVVLIIVPMRAVRDCTTSIAPLPTFSGWPGADLEQHLSQFLTTCIAKQW
jgi:hypothetical protein